MYSREVLVHCDDKEAFDLIFACAKSAYSFNDALLDSCKLLSDLIQRPEASGKAILDSLLQTLESVGDGEMVKYFVLQYLSRLKVNSFIFI